MSESEIIDAAFVHCWDWKETPDFEDIKDAIIRHGKDCKIVEINTRSDEYCVVIGPAEMTASHAARAYVKAGGYDSVLLLWNVPAGYQPNVRDSRNAIESH